MYVKSGSTPQIILIYMIDLFFENKDIELIERLNARIKSKQTYLIFGRYFFSSIIIDLICKDSEVMTAYELSIKYNISVNHVYRLLKPNNLKPVKRNRIKDTSNNIYRAIYEKH